MINKAFNFAFALVLVICAKEVMGYFDSSSSSSWGTAAMARQHHHHHQKVARISHSALASSIISVRGGAATQAGEDEIRIVIQTYLDSMFESSGDKVRDAFHPNAKITGYLGPPSAESFKEMSVEEFAALLESATPSPKDKGEILPSEILSIVVTGTTAVAILRDDYGGMTFVDILSFIKANDKWSIYNKLFHVEGPAASAAGAE